MTITLFCAKCYKTIMREKVPASETLSCPRCGEVMTLTSSASLQEGRAVDRCCVCNCTAFYIEKDFNKKLGCLALLVAVGLYIYFADQQWAILVLLAAAGLDMVLYLLVKNKTVCYRCLAEYRGFAPHPEHAPFDNKTAAYYAEYKK